MTRPMASLLAGLAALACVTAPVCVSVPPGVSGPAAVSGSARGETSSPAEVAGAAAPAAVPGRSTPADTVPPRSASADTLPTRSAPAGTLPPRPLRPPCDPAPGDSLLQLTVLSTNDLHGALEPKVHPWSGGRPVGGAATLGGYVARARAANPDGTLLLDGGDIMQGTPISNLAQGESVIAAFNAIGYDAAAVGNHEFDWGIETLERRIAQARFPLLTANVVLKAGGVAPPWAVPTAIVERKGLRIGLIGLTTQSTPVATLPAHVAEFQFTDLAEAVNREVPRLEAEGADLIVVVAHAGGYFSPDSSLYAGEIVEAVRRMSPAVDLVVSGHSHTLLNGELNGIALVQARSSGTALAEVHLWVSVKTRRVVCSDAEVLTTYADAVPPDPAVAAVVKAFSDRVAAVSERIVAEAAHRLGRDRRSESVLGDLIADAQRAAAGTQIALMNSGGIREEIDAGPISWREAFEVQPFANVLYRFDLRGRTLRAALENGVEGDHGLVQVSGVRFEVDAGAPRGRRVLDLRLEDGTPVADDSTYSVTTNNFMAQGGDGYTMLRDAPDVTNTGIVDLDAFVGHLADLPQPIRYEVQGRIRFAGRGPAARGRGR